jgi:LmbE family N-acetylglucosaminyl deacetylase
VFCYQTPSSTVDFQPDRFVPVDEFMDRKLAVIRSYTSQVKQRRYLDAELLRATSRYWSRYGQSRFVEPFEVARDTETTATLTGARLDGGPAPRATSSELLEQPPISSRSS